MITHKLIKFQLVISYARDNKLNDAYLYVYTENYDETTLLSEVILSDPPEVDENLNEIFPEIVVKNKFEVFCDSQLIQDVVVNVLYQNSTTSDEIIMKALKYYLENDDFMSIQPEST